MNKIVLITGASSGYGKATAKAFKENGDTVIMTARNLEKLNSACGIGETADQLLPEDIAETVLYIANLPQRAVVEDVTVWGIDKQVNPLVRRAL